MHGSRSLVGMLAALSALCACGSTVIVEGDPTSTSSSGGSGGAGGQTPTPAGPCGGPEAIHDDFEGDDVLGVFGLFGESVALSDGALRLGATEDDSGLARSWHAASLDERACEVKVSVDSPEIEAAFRLIDEFQDSGAAIRLSGGELIFETTTFSTVPITSVPYDPAAHAWWRLREDGDSLLFETSADGTSWQERGDALTIAPIDHLYLELEASTFGAPGTMIVDEVNTLRPRDWCSTDAFRDDFTEDFFIAWDFFDTGRCDVIGGDGVLIFDFGTGDTTFGRCELTSRTGFDITDGAITLEAPMITPQSAAESWLGVVSPMRQVAMGATSSTMWLEVDGDASTRQDLGVDPSEVAYWRLAVDGDTFLFETRGADGSWTTRESIALPAFETDAVKVILGAALLGVVADPITINAYNPDLP